jgi:Peptidase_G2, IMC autoproteolytic cleavage domain
LKRRAFLGSSVGVVAGTGVWTAQAAGQDTSHATRDSLSDVAIDSEGKVEWDAAKDSAGPFRLEASNEGGNPRLYMAYNMTPTDWSLVNEADRGMNFGFETDYFDGTDHRKMEMYWQYQFISGFGNEDTCTYRRSLMAQWDKETNLPTILYLSSGVSGGVVLAINDGTGNPYQEQVIGKMKAHINGPSLNVYNQPGGKTKALAVDSVATEAATGLRIKAHAASAGVHVQASSSELHESLYLDSLGAGPLVLNQDSGGAIVVPNSGISAEGSWNSGGVGYAEYFEWEDGNPATEDRRGTAVVLAGEKIRPAGTFEKGNIIGVVAARPAVIGDVAEMIWNGAYARDVFGANSYEDAPVVAWNDGEVDHRYFEDRIPGGLVPPTSAVRGVQKRQILSTDYDPAKNYTPRSQRKEWAAVALIGKVVLRKGQPANHGWRKLKDIDESHELWLIR